MNSLKNPGESFDDVLRSLYKLIDVTEDVEEHIKKFPGYPNLENIPLEVRGEIIRWMFSIGDILARASPMFSKKRLSLE